MINAMTYADFTMPDDVICVRFLTDEKEYAEKKEAGEGGITNALANFVLLQKQGNDDDAAATAHTHVLCKDEMIGCTYSGDKRLSN